MAATKCIESRPNPQLPEDMVKVQLFFRSNVRMGKKCDLSDFDRGMIVGMPDRVV